MATLSWTNSDTGEFQFVRLHATTSEEPTDTVTITDHPVEQGANIVDHARDEPEKLSIEGVISNTASHIRFSFSPVGHYTTTQDDDDTNEATTSLVQTTARTMGAPGTTTVQLDVPSPPLEISESGLLQAGVGALTSLLTGKPSQRATAISAPTAGQTPISATVFAPSTGTPPAQAAYDLLLGAMRGRELIVVQVAMRSYIDMLIERIAKPRKTGDGSAVHFQIDLRRIRIAESETVVAPKPTEPRGTTTKNKGAQSKKKTKPKPRDEGGVSFAEKIKQKAAALLGHHADADPEDEDASYEPPAASEE